jgi:hypothetical protein
MESRARKANRSTPEASFPAVVDRPAPRAATPTHLGYSVGCVCVSCLRREGDVRTGRLYYTRDGKLRARRLKAPVQPWEAPAAA